MVKDADSKTDAAALGGGVVAIAMTMFADPGPYDAIGVAVGLTLWLLILAYLGAHNRNPLQSAALAAVLGIISIPIWGYWVERAPADASDSMVSPDAVLQAWFDASLVLFAVELIWQKLRGRLAKEEHI